MLYDATIGLVMWSTVPRPRTRLLRRGSGFMPECPYISGTGCTPRIDDQHMRLVALCAAP
jgi:hypothetical protein